jgi:outer membrane murein-binding lipoprotein Lpp
VTGDVGTVEFLLNWLSKMGIPARDLAVAAIVAVGAIAAWWMRGRIDDGQISGIKAQLNAAQERLDGQVGGLKAQLDARDERLVHTHEMQEGLTRELAVARERIAQLEKDMPVVANASAASPDEIARAVKTLQEVQLAIQSATTANTALGSSLAGPAPALFGPFEPPTHEGTRFRVYGPLSETDHAF